MKIDIHADLSKFIKEMADCNGISLRGFGNNLLEKGVRLELIESGYTEDSISAFMHDLRVEKKCNWHLLTTNGG